MSVEQTIETYLKNLALQHEEDQVREIFRFLAEEIRTENAAGNEERIAKLFCRAVESLDQSVKPKDDIKNEILDAFANIRTIENNAHNDGELMCIYLLNLLYSKEESLEEVEQNEFVLLLDNLEKICCLFKIIDVKGDFVFPIGRFLFRLINSDNLFYEIDKASSVQALMLALQVFDKSQYPKELEDIQNLIDRNNLEFIKYLFHRCIRLGEDDWKKNYEQNGLLVLYDTKENKVLIRNNKRSYFRSKFNKEIYKLSDVTAEKNAKNEEIAYFVEYPLDKDNFVDLSQEFSKENNWGRISQILDIIYYHRNYNVILEYTLHDRDGVIYPTNPYGENDSYVIDEGVAYKDGKNHISNKLFKFGLLKISGSGLSYINLGLIVKLDEIFAIECKDFKINVSSNLNKIIACWLEFCNDKKKCFDEFFKIYEEQISYIFDRNKLYEKKYENEYLIPETISKELLQKLELDEKLSKYRLEKCKLKIDYIQEEKIITDSKDEKLENFIIKDIAGEDVNDFEGDFYALVNDSAKIIYIGTQVNYYYLMLVKINQINSIVVNDTDRKKIKEVDIKSIANQMSCFKNALNECHPGLHIKSVARYRILHHLMLIDTSDSYVDEWLTLIKKHQIEDFSVVRNKSPLEKVEGILYVPKNRLCTQSTLSYIYERYIKNSTGRDIVNIYDQVIEKRGNTFYTGGEKIERLVLLFDTIQNGKSTKETIDKYINGKCGTNSDTIMTFVCDGKVINLSEILNSNNCKIEIFSIYAADTGINSVKEHVQKQYSKIDIKVLDPIKKLTSVVNKQDLEIIKKLYPKNLAGRIHEGQYLVVREYNQPKLNIMCDKLLEIERVVALFCKRLEL